MFDYQRDGYAGHRVAAVGASDSRVLDDAEHEHDDSNDTVRQPKQQTQRVPTVHVVHLPAEFVESVSQPGHAVGQRTGRGRLEQPVDTSVTATQHVVLEHGQVVQGCLAQRVDAEHGHHQDRLDDRVHV